MKTGKFMGCVFGAVLLLTGCGSSGQAQMTPEKFKDM
jgi:major membrane immunogen (membrane-anchored lipoprotein)